MKEHPTVGISGSNNSGNFVKLLNYRSCWEDTNLKHLESAAQIVWYKSTKTENKLIDYCGERVIKKCSKKKISIILFLEMNVIVE